MAAPQWGINKKIFLCRKEDESYEVIINPTYEPVDDEEELVTGWEGCFSVPGAKGLVLRHAKVKTTHQDEEGRTIERVLEGWPARVWQHETDHTLGLLYDDKEAAKCIEFVEVDGS
jgi:peptide deformylase